MEKNTAFIKFSNAIKKFFEIIVFILFAMLVVIVFAQVVNRFLGAGSLTWSEELSRFILVFMIYLASVLTFVEGKHISVDALTTFLKGTPLFICEMVSRLAILVFVYVVAIGTYEFLPKIFSQFSPSMKIPMGLIYISIPISMFLTGVLAILQLINITKEFRISKKNYKGGNKDG